MRAAVPLVVLLALAACANPARLEREAYLTQFVGQPEEEVVREMGVPSRTIDTGGRRFLAYVDRRTEYVRPVPMFSPFMRGGAFNSMRYDEMVERSCETTFEIETGKVKGVRMHGNGCV